MFSSLMVMFSSLIIIKKTGGGGGRCFGLKKQIRGGTNRVFGKPCFCPLLKGAVLTKTAKMTNLHSILTENKGFAPQTPENDEKDENGGCHSGKGMV